MYDRNIIGTSSEIFGYLRQSSENVRKMFEKCSETFVKPSEQFWKIFGNLRKVVGNLRKIVKSGVLCIILYKSKTMQTLFQVLGLCVSPNFRYSSKCFAETYRAQYENAMLVCLRGTPIWRPENSVNIWNLQFGYLGD